MDDQHPSQKGPPTVRYKPQGGSVQVVEFAKDIDPFRVLEHVEHRLGLDASSSTGKNEPPYPATSERSEGAAAAHKDARTPDARRGEPKATPPSPAAPNPTELAAPAANALASSRSPAGTGDLSQPRQAAGVRDTSMRAYRSLEWSGKLSDQQKQVLAVVVKPGPYERRANENPAHGDWTRQEIAKASGLGINAVAGRVHELLQDPFAILEELEPRKCTITNNTARPLRVIREDVVIHFREESGK